MTKLNKVEIAGILEAEPKAVEGFIAGRKKSEVLTDFIINGIGDLIEAEKWWKDNNTGSTATGFIGGFDEALVKKDLSDKEVEDYVKEHGSLNTLRHLSSYKARAKLARDVRASLKVKK